MGIAAAQQGGGAAEQATVRPAERGEADDRRERGERRALLLKFVEYLTKLI